MNKHEEIELLAISLKLSNLGKEVFEASILREFDMISPIFYKKDKSKKKGPLKAESDWEGCNMIESAVLTLLLTRHEILATQLYNQYDDEGICLLKEHDPLFKDGKNSMEFRMWLEEPKHFDNMSKSLFLEDNGINVSGRINVRGQSYCQVKISKKGLKEYVLDIIDNNPIEIEHKRKVLPSLF